MDFLLKMGIYHLLCDAMWVYWGVIGGLGPGGLGFEAHCPLWSPYVAILLIFGDPRNPNHRDPNHQWTISWKQKSEKKSHHPWVEQKVNSAMVAWGSWLEGLRLICVIYIYKSRIRFINFQPPKEISPHQTKGTTILALSRKQVEWGGRCLKMVAEFPWKQQWWLGSNHPKDYGGDKKSPASWGQ